MKYFGNIVIHEKGRNEDYRSFCNCSDEEGVWWELRGYGLTPEEACSDVFGKYNDDTQDWSLYGYVVPKED